MPPWFASHPGAAAWAVEAGLTCSWTISAPSDQFVTLDAQSVWLHCHSNWQTLGIYDGQEASIGTLLAQVGVVIKCFKV